MRYFKIHVRGREAACVHDGGSLVRCMHACSAPGARVPGYVHIYMMMARCMRRDSSLALLYYGRPVKFFKNKDLSTYFLK